MAAGVPLSSPALGGDCSLDSATVSFLVRLAVGAQAELDRRNRREKEEKAKKAKEAKESSKQFLDQLRAKAWRELEERLGLWWRFFQAEEEEEEEEADASYLLSS